MDEPKSKDRFAHNPEIAAAVKAAWQVLAPLDRGAIVTHEQIAQASGVSPYSQHWNFLIGKLKKRCEKLKGITLWKGEVVGTYKLLTKGEQLSMVPQKRHERANRQFKRALDSVQSLPIKGLSAHEQDLRDKQIRRMKDARKFLRQQRNRDSVLGRGTDNGHWARDAQLRKQARSQPPPTDAGEATQESPQ